MTKASPDTTSVTFLRALVDEGLAFSDRGRCDERIIDTAVLALLQDQPKIAAELFPIETPQGADRRILTYRPGRQGSEPDIVGVTSDGAVAVLIEVKTRTSNYNFQSTREGGPGSLDIYTQVNPGIPAYIVMPAVRALSPSEYGRDPLADPNRTGSPGRKELTKPYKNHSHRRPQDWTIVTYEAIAASTSKLATAPALAKRDENWFHFVSRLARVRLD